MQKRNKPHRSLKRIFHEPSRLAILSALCTVQDGLTFGELKEECELTDGNLSRHLKTLTSARVVRIKKEFVKNKPLTTVILTDRGRESFIAYLRALESVLKKAAEALGGEETSTTPMSLSIPRLSRA